MADEKIVAPYVNLNGSTAQSLLADYVHAKNAVDAALTELSKVTPHGRDYQTVSRDVFERAQRQHRRRVMLLTLVSEELTEISLALAKQRNVREKRG